MTAPLTPRRIVLTGASRGLGLEFTRLWLAAGHDVFALARQPEQSSGLDELARRHGVRLRLQACDVGDDTSVSRARDSVAAIWDGIDLLLNSAGTFGRYAARLDELDLDEVRRVFEVNTLGPIRVTRAFLPLLQWGSRPVLVHITSLMGSIGDNASGRGWAYRLSKAALNMASRNLAHELSETGIPSVLLHPGWVRTEMGGPDAPLGVEESVSAMIATIDTLTMEHSGGLFDRHGKPLPW